jgi:hypothetical protein
MEIPQISARSESKSTQAACADKAGEHGGAAESDCARAIAQAESVLREISSVRRRSPELSSSVSQKAESAIPAFATIRGAKPYTQSYRTAAQFGIVDLRLVKTILDPLFLDPGLDFIVLHDGAIELTETGFRRMVQAHSVELDVVIGVDGRDLLRLPARRTDVVDALSRGSENSKRSLTCASLPEEPVRCAGTSKSCSRQETKRLP